MIIGAGNWAFGGKTIGGHVPIVNHTHDITVDDDSHYHNLCFYNNNYNGTGGDNPEGDRHCKSARGLENDCTGSGCTQTCIDVNAQAHNHDASSSEPKGNDLKLTDHAYSSNTIPLSMGVQFWIRMK